MINNAVSRNEGTFEGEGPLIVLQFVGLFCSGKEKDPGFPGRGVNLFKLDQHTRVAMIPRAEFPAQYRTTASRFLRYSDFRSVRRQHGSLSFTFESGMILSCRQAAFILAILFAGAGSPPSRQGKPSLGDNVLSRPMQSQVLKSGKNCSLSLRGLIDSKTIARRTAHSVSNFMPLGSIVIGLLRSIDSSRALRLSSIRLIHALLHRWHTVSIFCSGSWP